MDKAATHLLRFSPDPEARRCPETVGQVLQLLRVEILAGPGGPALQMPVAIPLILSQLRFSPDPEVRRCTAAEWAVWSR